MTKFKNMIGMSVAALSIISVPALASATTTAAKPAAAHVAKPVPTRAVPARVKTVAAAPVRAVPTQKPATVAHAAPVRAVRAKAVAAAPVRAAPAARPATRVAAARTNGRMVQARLANGKIVTYNCSLAGNRTKQACRS